jgi:hypothetical protein
MLVALCELNANHLNLFYSFIGSFRCTWAPVDWSDPSNSNPSLLLPTTFPDLPTANTYTGEVETPPKRCYWRITHSVEPHRSMLSSVFIRAVHLSRRGSCSPIFQRPTRIQARRNILPTRYYKRVTYVVKL